MDNPTSVTPNERTSNDHAIAAIAQETHNPIPVVKRIYDDEFMRLRAKAHVLEYVALFATRHTKEILRGRRPRSRTQAYAHA